MPEVVIHIGGREFAVACQEGEEHYLNSAAEMLDAEASSLAAQIGRLPEARMLLMSGLMLADKTAGMEDQLKVAQDRLAAVEAELEQARSASPAAAERVEVEVIPDIVTDSMGQIADRAEALAAEIEQKVAAG